MKNTSPQGLRRYQICKFIIVIILLLAIPSEACSLSERNTNNANRIIKNYAFLTNLWSRNPTWGYVLKAIDPRHHLPLTERSVLYNTENIGNNFLDHPTSEIKKPMSILLSGFITATTRTQDYFLGDSQLTDKRLLNYRWVLNNTFPLSTRKDSRNINSRISDQAKNNPLAHDLQLWSENSDWTTLLDKTPYDLPRDSLLSVNTGLNQSIIFPNSALLIGQIGETRIPARKDFKISWSQRSGPSAINFSNAHSLITYVNFNLPGEYTIRLSVSTSNSMNFSDILINVLFPNRQCLPPPSGLVAWWPGDGNAHDIVGGNNGIMGNAVSFTSGKVGLGFEFFGISNLTPQAIVRIPHTENLNLTAVTMEAWILINTFPPPEADWCIATKGVTAKDSENYSMYIRNINNSGKLKLLFEYYNPPDSPTGFSWIMSQEVSLNLLEFHHVALTADGDQIKFYVDGRFISQSAQPGPLRPNDFPFQIGSAFPAYGNRFNGIIDELTIYNRALTAYEIEIIYMVGTSGKCKEQHMNTHFQLHSFWDFVPAVMRDPAVPFFDTIARNASVSATKPNKNKW